MSHLQKLVCLVLVFFLIAFGYFLFMSPTVWAYPTEWKPVYNWKVLDKDLENYKHTGMIGTGIACGLCIGILLVLKKR